MYNYVFNERKTVWYRDKIGSSARNSLVSSVWSLSMIVLELIDSLSRFWNHMSIQNVDFTHLTLCVSPL